MTLLRAGIPAVLLALILLAPAAGAQQNTGAINPLDIFKNRKPPAADSSGARSPAVHAAPPTMTTGLPVRPLRVPGVTASLGDSIRTVLGALGVWATAQPSEGGQLYTASVTWFAETALAHLRFQDGRLVQAEFELDHPDPEWVRFVGDELRRQGYRRSCRTLDDVTSDCTWSGRTEVWISCDASKLTASVVVPAERRVPAPPDSTALAAAASAESLVLPETLFTDRVTRSGRSAPLIDHLATPKFPDAARRAGVQGIVHVLALVDENGIVIGTSVMNSIRELDAAALEAAARYRFRPYREKERVVRFRVDIPVRFLLF